MSWVIMEKKQTDMYLAGEEEGGKNAAGSRREWGGMRAGQGGCARAEGAAQRAAPNQPLGTTRQASPKLASPSRKHQVGARRAPAHIWASSRLERPCCRNSVPTAMAMMMHWALRGAAEEGGWC